MYKILIVEDETIAAEYLKSILTERGWDVIGITDNCEDSIRAIKKHNPNLILMDIMIEGPKSGCEVAIEARKISNCAIVFTTAYADEEMLNYAMQIKADGYILKPYNEREIIATISLLSIKDSPSNSNFRISNIMGGFSFNYETNLLYKDNVIVKLGPKALKLIQILCKNRDNCVSYEDIYKSVWDGKLNLKKMQMVVYRIREITQTDFIENINGVGYQIKIDHAFNIK